MGILQRSQAPSAPTVLFITAVLLGVPFAAIAGAPDAPEATCNLLRTGTVGLPDGGSGLSPDGNVVEAGIPAACSGAAFELTANNVGDDLDVCWVDGSGAGLGCNATAGGEVGIIPDGAVEAHINYFTGAGTTYVLRSVSNELPLTLYFHDVATPSGNGDTLFGGSEMDQSAPTRDAPGVWYSEPVAVNGNDNTFYNANWHWEPGTELTFTDAEITVTFWAINPGGPAYDDSGWDVRVYGDSTLLARRAGGGGFTPADPGVPSKYTLTFEPRTFTAESISVFIDPFYVDGDWAHAILYDSVDYPSNVALTQAGAGGDTTPPSQVVGLATDSVAPTSIALSWDAATDDTGVEEYEVHRGTSASTLSLAATTTGTSYADPGLDAGTTYYYAVRAVDGAGNVGTLSSTLAVSTPASATTRTFFVHDDGTDRYVNELNTTGDADGSGYNILGSTVATAEYRTGTTVLDIRHAYPSARPANDAFALDATRPATATFYVQPNINPAAVFDFELALYDGSDLLGSNTTTVVAELEGWTPVEFEIDVPAEVVDRGALRVTFRLTAGNAGYVVGYEGNHASSVSLPVTATAPLTVEAAITSDAPYIEDTALDLEATAFGGVAPYTYSWTFETGPGASGASVSRTFADPGRQLVRVTVTDDVGDTASAALSVRILQTDFTGESRVVVAVIDSGINPYHEVYRRPGADLPLSAFTDATNNASPRTVSLTLGSDYSNNVAADSAVWSGISTNELIYFEDTNVLGISMGNAGTPILDDHSHGTATSSTVLDAWPDAIIVMVENDNLLFSSGIPNAFAWAQAQPWIDVVSSSLGNNGNAPEPLFLYQAPAIQRAAWQDGKLWANSAGNDPSPLLTDGLDGSPWAISVTGTQAGGKGREILSSTVYPDVASNYTVTAAAHQSTTGSIRIGGTSFSCPTVAGTLAGAIHQLRRDAGHTDGIVAGELAPGVTNEDVRNAMNKTAMYVPYDGYVVGLNYNGDVAVLPVAPWLEIGWGHVDARIIDDIVDVVQSGNYSLPGPTEAKGQASIYMDAMHASRQLFWNDTVTSAFA